MLPLFRFRCDKQSLLACRYRERFADNMFCLQETSDQMVKSFESECKNLNFAVLRRQDESELAGTWLLSLQAAAPFVLLYCLCCCQHSKRCEPLVVQENTWHCFLDLTAKLSIKSQQAMCAEASVLTCRKRSKCDCNCAEAQQFPTKV